MGSRFSSCSTCTESAGEPLSCRALTSARCGYNHAARLCSTPLEMSGVGARQRCQAGPLGRPPEVVTRGGTAVGVPGRLVGVLPLADVGQHGPEPLVVDDGRP